MPTGRGRIPTIDDGDWREAPAIKARLAGGYCLRAPAQGACPYANICEHCPSFRTDAASITVLGAQKLDAVALAEDAERRGWVEGPSVTVASSPASTYCWPKGTPGDLSRDARPRSSVPAPSC